MSKTPQPDTVIAMQKLVSDVKTYLPFRSSTAELCCKPCNGCTKKLMRFLEQEIENWEYLIAKGEVPSLGEINRLGKISKKIYAVLQRNRNK